MAMLRQPKNFPETVKEVRRQLALSQEEQAHRECRSMYGRGLRPRR